MVPSLVRLKGRKEPFVNTPAFDTTPINMSDFGAALKGRVITPDDADYDKVRTVFYGGIDRRPALIVRVANASDVSRVISLARETGLESAVRSGGHSMPGHSVTDGGIALDLSDMQALEIDTENRTAWAETGLTASAYTTAAGAYGVADRLRRYRFGWNWGITLGGGVGYLVRKYGLTIDSLLAADVVTADGHLIRVDAELHPDLFWAIRGGGGNFGVAIRFQFRLHEVGTIVGGMLMLPATPDVIASFIAEAEAAPEELSTIANVVTAPPMPFIPAEYHGRPVIMAMLAFAGPVEDGQRAIVPFRALATPIADMVQPMPYPQIYAAGRRRVPPARGDALNVHGYHRSSSGRYDCRLSPGIDRANGRSPASSARWCHGPCARRRDRIRAPQGPDYGKRRRAVRAPRRRNRAQGLGHALRVSSEPGRL